MLGGPDGFPDRLPVCPRAGGAAGSMECTCECGRRGRLVSKRGGARAAGGNHRDSIRQDRNADDGKGGGLAFCRRRLRFVRADTGAGTGARRGFNSPDVACNCRICAVAISRDEPRGFRHSRRGRIRVNRCTSAGSVADRPGKSTVRSGRESRDRAVARGRSGRRRITRPALDPDRVGQSGPWAFCLRGRVASLGRSRPFLSRRPESGCCDLDR